MVATSTGRKAVIRPPRETWRVSIPGIRHATDDEGCRLFNYQARKLLGITGEEFLRRWDAGHYRQIADPVESRNVRRLASLIPSVRRTRA